MQNARVERSRPGCDQEQNSCAALIGPTPTSSSSQGTLVLMSCSISVSRSLASASSIRIRRAVWRSAMTVARCSAECLGERSQPRAPGRRARRCRGGGAGGAAPRGR